MKQGREQSKIARALLVVGRDKDIGEHLRNLDCCLRVVLDSIDSIDETCGQ